ncbi:hypothetical protein GCM10022198_16550 [Klugiella xanthotipulae]|uniref:ESAT-6-like protein n=1 Tax=Klugiella xanthotipulae TaxID=244735 RepID=A0A543HH89_9MICO|nr:WXG100 family type VII secretion target [Klugiella xanthotipulae]TQM57691.1 WXG100 family type VII secretion target [Klugiella xanthotipulae]
MNDEIKVDQAGMLRLIDLLREAIRSMEQILADLDQQVSLLRDRWTGAAAREYQRAQALWRSQLDEMSALLARHRDSVITSQELFRGAAARNREIWS